ncbi:hypothetical protein D3C81_2255920 [compost metagenome]
MLLRHILPERVIAVKHARHTRLNQQAQRANSLLTREDEVAKIALTHQREVVVKRQLIAEDL